MRLDRLSGLMDRFELSVDLNLSDKSMTTANIVVVGDRDTLVATRVVLSLGEPLDCEMKSRPRVHLNIMNQPFLVKRRNNVHVWYPLGSSTNQIRFLPTRCAPRT